LSTAKEGLRVWHLALWLKSLPVSGCERLREEMPVRADLMQLFRICIVLWLLLMLLLLPFLQRAVARQPSKYLC